MKPERKAAALLNTGTATKVENNEYVPLVASFRLPCKVYFGADAEGIARNIPVGKSWHTVQYELQRGWRCLFNEILFYDDWHIGFLVSAKLKWARGEPLLSFALVADVPPRLSPEAKHAFFWFGSDALQQTAEQMRPFLVPTVKGFVVESGYSMPPSIEVFVPVHIAFDAPPVPLPPPFRLPGSTDNADTRKERCQ
jgi:hypothetical protein